MMPPLSSRHFHAIPIRRIAVRSAPAPTREARMCNRSLLTVRRPGGPPMNGLFPRSLLVLILVICPVVAFGQAVFGGISGTITDPSGAAITDAKVTITETSKGVSYNTTTNSSGNFTQSHLTVGNYDVRIEASGFEVHVRRNVRVTVDEVAPVNAE